MNKNKTCFFIFLFLLSFSSQSFSYSSPRDAAIQKTFDSLKAKPVQRAALTMPSTFSMPFFFQRQNVIRQTLDDLELGLAVKIGYLTGNTTYDFASHTSELKFPFDLWIAGGDFSLGYKNFSLNTELLGSITKESGSRQTDKDWLLGALISSTESTSKTDAVILDLSARYDFYHKAIQENNDLLLLKASDEIKFGAVIGYRYERFDFDLYDLYDVISQTMSYADEKIGTYKIEYSIPYAGVALDILRQNYGFNMGIKIPINPVAEDLDNHLLRGLAFYGDYNSTETAFMFDCSAFWKFKDNWLWSVGVDGTFLNIDGTTWDETHDPAWDAVQSTDLTQLIISTGLKYSF